MIIPIKHHGHVSYTDTDYYIKFNTCELGTYTELYDAATNLPVENGKLFLISKNGTLIKFTNVNEQLVNIDENNTILIIRG